MSEVQASLSQVERQLTNSDLQLAFIQLNQKLTRCATARAACY